MTTPNQIDRNSSKKVLVIGGGAAGLSCANHLSRLGVSVIMVEKNHFLGGQALHFFCKATDTCQKCNYCLVEEQLSEIVQQPQIRILTRTRLAQAEPLSGGGFSVTLIQEPAYIDPIRCNNCGLCYQVCPAVEEGAIIKGLPSSFTHPLYRIDHDSCLYFKDPHARLCQESCPEKAIDLDRRPNEEKMNVDAVVLATGYTPFDPQQKPRLGYGEIPNVITAMELEEMIRSLGALQRPSDRKRPERIAFIQCVGSRDLGLDHLFCSRVCCGYALRMSKAIKHRWPEVKPYVFFMDIQNFGKDFLPLYQEASQAVTLIRGIPGAINPAPGDQIAVGFQEKGGGPPQRELFDLLVLSIGLMPSAINQTWADQFQLPVDEDGFLPTGGGPHVFPAGTISQPMDIAQSIAHGGQAARRVAKSLGVSFG